MYIVLIGWLYVTMMMAVVEATSANGTVLGAIITFALYGVIPTGIMAYLMATPARKRAIRAQEKVLAAELAARQEPNQDATQNTNLRQPDAGGHATAATQGGVVPPVRKEP